MLRAVADGSPRARRPDIDALRVFATGAVFLYHCAKHFDPSGWHVTRATTSPGIQAAIDATSLWLMPLFFLLSGASTGAALQHRPTRKLIGDRALRLLVPFAFGVIVVVPPQVWAERVSHGAFEGSFWAFFPHYFDGLYAFGGNFAWMGLHLWYLALLFVISVALAPVSRWLATRVPDSPIVVVVPVATIAAIEIALIGHDLDNRGLGGWSIAQYPVFYALGIVLSGTPKARALLQRFALPLLAIGLVAGSTWAFAPDDIVALAPRAVWRVARTVGALGMLYGALGLAERTVRHRKWIDVLNEASMPFYVLHQTVIVLFALALLELRAPIGVAYVLLATGSFAITAGMTALVLRIGALRPLFGLKQREPGAGPLSRLASGHVVKAR